MKGPDTYIYLHGIAVSRDVRLCEHVTLMPADCKPFRDCIDRWAKNEVDEGIILIFLPHVSSQLRILADDPKLRVMLAWNSMWDAILLSAISNREVAFNFQCDTPAELIEATSDLRVINRAFRGLSHADPSLLPEAEALWLESNFDAARSLLKKPGFENAVHCLWSYGWHTLPRARLALLWSGIEGLFAVDSELVFRVSLYCATFLEPDDTSARRQLFDSVKKLYRDRSAAVHGSPMKGDAAKSVEASSQLLHRLIRRCIEQGQLPDASALAP